MALEKAVKSRICQPRDVYEAKKREIFATVDPKTERVVNGVIYCTRCHQPKTLDMHERPFIVKCLCPCEVEARERRENAHTNYSWVRNGDYNPFDYQAQ